MSLRLNCRFLAVFILPLFLCAISAGFSEQADAAIEEAVIAEIKGKVTITDSEDVSREAVPGGYALGGEIIETGEDGYVRLVFPDGSTLELLSDTRITLNDSRVRQGSISSVLLFIGRIYAKVQPVEGEETVFEVETATAVCGVRGTEFTAAVGADGSTRVGVEEGVVVVTSEEDEISVKAGTETTAGFGPGRLSLSPYRPSEEDWESWQKNRERIFIERAEEIVPGIKKSIIGPRMLIYAQDKRLRSAREEYMQWEKKKGYTFLRKPRLGPRQKEEIKKIVRNYYVLTRALDRADNRMVASYYLIQRVSDDASAHPEKYSPEFIEKLGQVKTELDTLDVRKLHRDNRRIIESHAEMLENMLDRYQERADLRGMPSAERLEQLKKQREDILKKRPL